ncbi:L,D-transpeptidase family protein [Pedobacter sp. SL55]|uniref:L,D-transpeptidase family protein n=1 Tax=Pedobacter sp. SL55 TaxID=2995161 RepID=UPI002271C930|nr:L,D-transpeptidase family protein [Pedobacter sp. SL55]WAC39403.1 L,D-transpeptidase family protein [Pedobacter sp. SL55]
MKTSFTSVPASRLTKFILIGWVTLILACISIAVYAQGAADSAIGQGKKHVFATDTALLNFPKTVERYYQAKAFRLSWVEKGHWNAKTAIAMMLLDCVRQFGLDPQDYHPNELLYSRLALLEQYPDSLSEVGRRAFDEFLTDAVITMINHLHYGKFNPFYSASEIDNGNLPHFNADFKLFMIIDAKDFYTELVKVQPAILEYVNLQKNMQLVLGQYILDSYEYPQANVRKMAINMERLRWLSSAKGNRIQVNIPSYQLKLTTGDTVNNFKVIVGNPENPTQTFESTLTRFTAAPDWKVPAEIFVAEILPNALKDISYLKKNRYSIYDNQLKHIKINRRRLKKISQNPAVYMARQSPIDENTLGSIRFRIDDQPSGTLYDHSGKNIFNTKERASSKGCLQIENPERLAKLLLVADGSEGKIKVLERALKDYQYKNFYLKNPVPIAVTYLTCEMIDSRLIIYKDIYQKDAELESKLFGEQAIRLADRRTNQRSIKKNNVKIFRR